MGTNIDWLPRNHEKLYNRANSTVNRAGIARNIYSFLILLLLSSIFTKVTAQSDTDFWFVAPHLANTNKVDDEYDRPVFFVVTAGDLPATVMMEMPALTGFHNRVLNLAAHETRLIIFGDGGHTAFANAQIDTIQNNIQNAAYVGIKYNRGIHFTATNLVNIYYQVDGSGSKDMFALKGSKALGNEFYTPFQTKYNPILNPPCYAQFHIVATEDNTQITVTPKTNIVGTNAGQSKNIVLNRGETFAARTVDVDQGIEGDPSTWLAGSHITSNKPVAVTVATDAVSSNAGDMVGDQIVPVNNVGTTYVVIRGYSTSSIERVYVLATQDGTNVYINGSATPAATLNKGEQYTRTMSTSNITCVVTSDKPVYVFQLSGYNNEACAALIPSMYSINSRRIMFYKKAATNHQVLVLVRDGNEDAFTVNGSATVLRSTDFVNVPNITGWKYARTSIASSVADGTVTVNNEKGAFSLGYFYTGTTTGTASFGYFSGYGTLTFLDTTYKCANASVTLDGGYAKSYEWTLPDGSKANTATITVTDTGRYTVVAYQDPFMVTATTIVNERFAEASIVASGGNDVGAGTYAYSVDLKGQSAVGVNYVWKVDGVQVSTDATYSATWTNADEHLITVDISDVAVGCTKTFSTVHHKLPDNVSDAECYVEPPSMTWGIKVDWSSPETNISEFIIPFVGDLDGDSEKIPEIVCFGTAGRITITSGSNATAVQTILIYDGRSHVLKNTITLPSHVTEYDGAAYGLFRRPADGKGLIVVATLDYKLRAYDIDGNLEWTSDVDYGSQMGDFAVNIGFADFNMDGFPELYVREKIYNASTGKLLARASPVSNTGSSWAHWTHNSTGWKLSSPLAADVIGDSKPELILGNEIYDVIITNTSGMSGNSIDLVRTATLPSGVTTSDGHAQVADFNLDGHPDILITNRNTAANNGGIVSVYVWDVFNNTTSSALIIYTTWSGKSIPLIADVNNDSKPDVIIQCDFNNTNDDMQVYEYDAATQMFVNPPLWTIDPDEDSYSNSATLFDFNHDGQNEVLITDQSKIRIFRGSDGYPLNSFTFKETTIMQYPVIADVDADGSADIITCGNDRLNILKSSGAPWASARKVWNQYMYNSVNVNEDLTIPQFQMNPATFFAGDDGQSGTPDDVQPYNNFLQQQTMLNTKGVPLWPTPDVKFAETPVFSYYGDGDSLVINMELTNIGDASLTAPFYISAYANTVATSNIMATDSSMTVLDFGDTLAAEVTIRNFSSYASLTNIIFRINDQGAAAYVQLECDYDNNEFEYEPATLLLAFNDTVSMLVDATVFIDVKLNDQLPAGCSSIVPEIKVAPLSGNNATIVNDSIEYTPAAGFYGVDSLVYRLSCASGSAEARVYIIVNKPVADSYLACTGSSVSAGFNAIADVTYLWYATATESVPDGSASDTRNCTAPSEWWVEACYKGNPLKPRFNIGISARPVPELTSEDISTCYNTTVTLVASSSDAALLIWYKDANYTDTIVKSASFETTNLESDTVFYVEALSANSCSSRNTVHVTVLPLPDLQVNDDAICSGNTATLQASSSTAVLFRWYSDSDYSDLISQSASFTTSTLDSDTAFYVETISADGCISSDIANVTVYPLPDLTVKDTGICSVNMTTFIVSSQNAASITWFSDAIYSNAINYSSSYATTLTADAVFYIEALSDKGCSTKDVMNISVVVTPPAVVAMDDVYLCYGEEITLSTLASEGAVNWNVDPANIRPLYSQDYIVTASKPYCPDIRDTVRITVGDSLYIYPAKLPEYSMYAEYEQQISSNAQSPVFVLIAGNLPSGLSLYRSGYISGQPSDDATTSVFTVEVEDEHNCTATQEYILEKEFSTPKAFTPNNDGINDYFMKGYKIVIFDRLGIEIFRGDDGWDGTYKNQPVSRDIYFYRVTQELTDGKIKMHAGYVGVE
jgi:gliding motility-associated-like protein